MIDKTFWKSIRFYKKYKPEITCPNCNKGVLTLLNENMKIRITKDGRELENIGEYLDVTFKFSALLICNNKFCQDVTATSGIGTVEQEYYVDEGGYDDFEYKEYFLPKFFCPPLNIINPRSEYPDKVRQILVESFSLFFADTSACANKIRQVVEEILSDHDVPRLSRKNRRQNFITLHKRIERFNTDYPELTDLGRSFFAIKFIGNGGSHVGEVDKDQLLDAYTILEHALDELYYTPKVKKKISKLAKVIIKKKGRK